MSQVTIDLPADTERLLREKARQGGLNLNMFLLQLAERTAHPPPATIPDPAADDDEFAERPWRASLRRAGHGRCCSVGNCQCRPSNSRSDIPRST